jgi:hypothetical protein
MLNVAGLKLKVESQKSKVMGKKNPEPGWVRDWMGKFPSQAGTG